MIERVYLDNIRSFVNFEWRPGPLAILLGANGTGKTALLDALQSLQSFVMGDARSSNPSARPPAPAGRNSGASRRSSSMYKATAACTATAW